MFDRLIGPAGLLREKTRVLVTHNLAFLARVDRVLVLQEGRLVEQGTLQQLMARNSKSFREFAEFIQSVESGQEEVGEQKDKAEQRTKKDKEKGRLTSAETKAEGSVNWRHYAFYLRSMNLPLFVLVLCFFLATQAFKVGGNLILAEWTKNFSPDSSWSYIGLYSLLLVLGSLASMGSQAGCQLRAVEASRKIHHSLLEKTMHAPMSFFETTPTGRTLNRFSSDLNIIDGKIPRQLKNFLSCLSIILSTLVVVSTVTPYFLLALLPVGAVFLLLQVYYTRTRRQVVRLQAVAKSPLFSQFSETINGVTTIRAYSEQHRFCQEFEEKVGRHLLCNYVSDMTNRWLSIRVEILGNFIVFFAALFAFYSRDRLSAGVIGLSISYAMQMIDGFGWTIRMAGELESDSVALERVREYEELPQEAAWESPGGTRTDWLTEGTIQFRGFSTRYRPDLDNVLTDFSLTVQSGQKVGIVGRTGAGKSSLSLALFRLMEASGGSITIDRQDISRLGLQDLRARLTIIPQEPTIFSGSLRFNLDPAEEFPDWELEEALRKAGLSLPLLQELSQAGAAFSLGEKQLVCLARALLRKSRVLVLDEATAAVDSATDEKIQETIRSEFADCTVLTIAHRLHTVTGGDRIILLDQGTIAESGKPGELLADTNSQFYKMAKAAGVAGGGSNQLES